jgi:hypothetical protein
LSALRVDESEEEKEQPQCIIAVPEPRLGQRRSSRKTRRVNYTDGAEDGEEDSNAI